MPIITESSCPYAVIDTTDTDFVIASLKDVFETAGWTSTSIPAFVIGTFGTISDGDEVLIASDLYTFTTDLTGKADGYVLLGGSTNASLQNLAAAINGDVGGSGVTYTASTTTNPEVAAVDVTTNKITLNTTVPGSSGNGLPVRAPGASWGYGAFTLDSPLSNNRLWFGGWKFRYRSAQKLSVYVYVFDCGLRPFSEFGAVRLQVQSGVSGIKGVVHGLDVPAPTGQLQVVVNGGGFFISNPGIRTLAGLDHIGTSCCGGLFQVAGSDVDTLPIEAWWSSGDGGGIIERNTPRRNLYYVATDSSSQNEGVWNGTRTNLATDKAVFRIVPKNFPFDPSFIYPDFTAAKIQWMGENPVVYDPIVAWGSTAGVDATIRGTIPDAVIRSLPDDMDTTYTDMDGNEWMNFTHQYAKGGLWLRINGASVAPTTNSSSVAQYRKTLNLGVKPTS